MLHVSVFKHHHQALKFMIWNTSNYACRCFEICEISQIFTSFYKVIVAFKYSKCVGYIASIDDIIKGVLCIYMSQHNGMEFFKNMDMHTNSDLRILGSEFYCLGLADNADQLGLFIILISICNISPSTSTLKDNIK
jgi:hypothetical protein